jgi:hypothetical protein
MDISTEQGVRTEPAVAAILLEIDYVTSPPFIPNLNKPVNPRCGSEGSKSVQGGALALLH